MPATSEIMKKLLVQIPCLNEQATLADVIHSIPRKINGFEQIHVMVIDDGSTDETVEVAIRAGADVVLSSSWNKGLARSFHIGIEFCLAEGYEVMVNTDGDNQYYQEKIDQLVMPIRSRLADIVIGDRETDLLGHFGFGKRFFQRVGSKVLGLAAGLKVSDGASGFRAYSRHAMSRLFIATKFSYAMEVLIQAGHKGLKVSHVSTGAKYVERPSRLFKSPLHHVRLSAHAIVKSYLLHKPSQIFGVLSAMLGVLGSIPFIRYVVLVLEDRNGDHIQSLILGMTLLIGSLLAGAIGIVAELSKHSRELTEESLTAQRLAGKTLKNVLEAEGYVMVHDSRL
jgi:glycosyltransferase involved in cell wall biosynthesis